MVFTDVLLVGLDAVSDGGLARDDPAAVAADAGDLEIETGLLLAGDLSDQTAVVDLARPVVGGVDCG